MFLGRHLILDGWCRGGGPHRLQQLALWVGQDVAGAVDADYGANPKQQTAQDVKCGTSDL